MNANEVVNSCLRVFDVEMSDMTRHKSTQRGNDCMAAASHLLYCYGGMIDKKIAPIFNKKRPAITIARKKATILMSIDKDFRAKYYAIQDACYLRGWL